MDTREQVIERYMRDAENKANSLYDRGYEAGTLEIEGTYAMGMEHGAKDAWQLMRDIADMSWERFSKAFCGYEGIGEVIQRLDYDEVRHCLEDFAKDELDRIEVGDEVIDPNGRTAIVTNADTHYHLFYPLSGKTWKAPKSASLTKTGRKFSQVEIFPL